MTSKERSGQLAGEPLEIAIEELREELSALGAELFGEGAVRVRRVSQDSREIIPGDLFVARSDGQRDGTAYAQAAVQRGARAILTDNRAFAARAPVELGCPALYVNHARFAMGKIAERLCGSPSLSLRVVGITGTNGKTTSTWLCQRALQRVGIRAGRIGTLGYEFEGREVDFKLTTPDADSMSRYLADARAVGAQVMLMEVSSHALEQRRADAVHFAVAAFTNLTQDHLDYHGDFETYASAKARLFLELAPEVCVIHVGNEFGRELAARAEALGRDVVRVGRDEGDIRFEGLELGAFGLRGELVVFGERLPYASRLVGEHNVENLLGCVGIAWGLGLRFQPHGGPSSDVLLKNISGADAVQGSLAAFIEALQEVPSAPGRLERCDEPADDITVLVDYAHTPDALERSLRAARGLLGVSDERSPHGSASGALWCVFGCGGDRDKTKRPLMGDAVGRLADRAILTNDNPRTEDPEAIAQMILPGLLAHHVEHQVILDRALAIREALRRAAPGDVVLIAGKGHEPYQLIGDRVIDFDDRVQAHQALAERRSRGEGAAPKAAF